MRGVFLDLDSVHPADLDLAGLKNSLEEWRVFEQTPAHLVGERIVDADIVVANKAPLRSDTLGAATRLKLICVAATGTNNVDIAAAHDGGIEVCNARDYATPSVAEAVFALLLTLVRRLDAYRSRVASGDWSDSPYFCLFDTPIAELSGKTLGIIGHGVLGHAVEKIARCFGMQVIICQRLHGTPESGRVPLPKLLGEADVISLHCPLTPQTRNLIGRKELRAMKSEAILINTARGGIIDEFALAEAIQQGWIGGAGIDVLGEEPPTGDNPLLQIQSPRLIVTPHVAWASRSARQRLIEEVTANIRAFRHGDIRNRVT